MVVSGGPGERVSVIGWPGLWVLHAGDRRLPSLSSCGSYLGRGVETGLRFHRGRCCAADRRLSKPLSIVYSRGGEKCDDVVIGTVVAVSCRFHGVIEWVGCVQGWGGSV